MYIRYRFSSRVVFVHFWEAGRHMSPNQLNNHHNSAQPNFTAHTNPHHLAYEY